MKKNHTRTANLIRQALTAMGDDFALQEARSHLQSALGSIANVGQKRAKRNSAAQMFKEKALRNNEEWWETVRENTKKFAEMQNESKTGDSGFSSA